MCEFIDTTQSSDPNISTPVEVVVDQADLLAALATLDATRATEAPADEILQLDAIRHPVLKRKDERDCTLPSLVGDDPDWAPSKTGQSLSMIHSDTRDTLPLPASE